MHRVLRLFKWIACAAIVLVSVYIVWILLFVISFFYAVPKYERIWIGDSRAKVESMTGFLYSREVDPTFLGGYRFVPPFEKLAADTNNTLVGYSFFGAGFTVIYDQDDKVVMKIDNRLDG